MDAVAELDQGPLSGQQLRTPLVSHVLFVVNGMAPPTHGGGSMDMWCTLSALQAFGARVTVAFWQDQTPAQWVGPASELRHGVTCINLGDSTPPTESRGWFGTDLHTFLGGAAYADRLVELVRDLKPDLVFALTFPALSALRKVTSVPILFEMEPFPSRMEYYRLKYRIMPEARMSDKAVELIRFLLRYARFRVQETQLAAQSTYITSMDPGQASRLEKRLGRPVSVYHVPMMDLRTVRTFPRTTGKKKIILVGHLRGLLSLCSLEFLSRRLIDRMQRELEPFELHLIGGYELPRRFAALRRHGNVILRGHVDDIEPEFRTADVVLSTSTLPFGSSARIRTALLFGSVLIAHRNSSQGIRELVHERNALLCETPEDYLRHLKRCFADEALCATLRANARRTYEQHFSPQAHQVQLSRLIAVTLEQHRHDMATDNGYGS